MANSNPHHPFVLTVLQHVTTDRLQRAVNALADGSMTVTLTRQTEAEIRALVKNGAEREYGVVLTPTLTTCSCKDALYRGVVCKHTVATALHVLRTPQAKREPQPEPVRTVAPPQRTIHLLLDGDRALCGVLNPTRCWRWPHWPETTWPETCTECAAVRTRPVLAAAA